MILIFCWKTKVINFFNFFFFSCWRRHRSRPSKINSPYFSFFFVCVWASPLNLFQYFIQLFIFSYSFSANAFLLYTIYQEEDHLMLPAIFFLGGFTICTWFYEIRYSSFYCNCVLKLITLNIKSDDKLNKIKNSFSGIETLENIENNNN